MSPGPQRFLDGDADARKAGHPQQARGCQDRQAHEGQDHEVQQGTKGSGAAGFEARRERLGIDPVLFGDGGERVDDRPIGEISPPDDILDTVQDDGLIAER